MRELSYQEWLDEAKEKFGEDPMQWAFVCPSCGNEATAQEWKDLGAEEGEVAFSCIGRRMDKKEVGELGGKKQPCNYAGGGLIRLNPVKVKFEDGNSRDTFEFAGQQEAQT